MLHQWFQSRCVQIILDFLLPRQCLNCQRHSSSSALLCQNCDQHLPWLGFGCQICARDLSCHLFEKNTPLICGQCLQNPPAFQQTLALFDYDPMMRTFIHKLKFTHELSMARLFGKLLEERLQQSYLRQMCNYKCVIPMPLHNSRLRKRGFNQALEIVKHTPTLWRLPILTDWVVRQKTTEAQAQLAFSERQRNVVDAFKINGPHHHHYRSVIVVDDVITTGQTVQALCKTLRLHGVENIWVIAPIRTQMT